MSTTEHCRRVPHCNIPMMGRCRCGCLACVAVRVEEGYAKEGRESDEARARTVRTEAKVASLDSALTTAREELARVNRELAAAREEAAGLRAKLERLEPDHREARLRALGFEPVSEEHQAENVLVNLGSTAPASREPAGERGPATETLRLFVLAADAAAVGRRFPNAFSIKRVGIGLALMVDA